MNWKVLVLAMFLVASFGFATENGTVDLKVTKVGNRRHPLFKIGIFEFAQAREVRLRAIY